MTGCGELHKPHIPDLKHLDEFRGRYFHSSEWPDDGLAAVTGKKVGLVGTGASAVQIAPNICEFAEDLYVFQRTPAWIIPFSSGTTAYSAARRFLTAVFPPLAAMQRWFLFWYKEFKFYPFTEKSRRDEGKVLAEGLAAYKRAVVNDDDVAEKLIPEYDLGCKRLCPTDKFIPV